MKNNCDSYFSLWLGGLGVKLYKRVKFSIKLYLAWTKELIVARLTWYENCVHCIVGSIFFFQKKIMPSLLYYSENIVGSIFFLRKKIILSLTT